MSHAYTIEFTEPDAAERILALMSEQRTCGAHSVVDYRSIPEERALTEWESRVDPEWLWAQELYFGIQAHFSDSGVCV